MSSNYRVVKLLKNHLYPTYQLHAFMANDQTTPQDGLRLAALTTMEWLTHRLGEEVPTDWASLPSPENYLTATDDDLPSLYINQGHVVNIVSLPEQGMWTLQITEPDLGSDPGNPAQARPAVPGRIIETNIAFVILTRQANESMAEIHDRMPVIVGEDAVRPYLTDLAVAEEIIAKAAPILVRHKA